MSLSASLNNARISSAVTPVVTSSVVSISSISSISSTVSSTTTGAGSGFFVTLVDFGAEVIVFEFLIPS